MPTLHVLLMQLPVPNNPATNVPLAAGYLKAYAQARGLPGPVQIGVVPRGDQTQPPVAVFCCVRCLNSKTLPPRIP